MSKVDTVIGKKFGRLSVVEILPKVKHRSCVLAVCDCGTERKILVQSLGKTLSCGCLQKEVAGAYWRKHGGSRTKLYKVWQSMVSRCHYSAPGTRAYKFYRQRGIAVCPMWRDFVAFKKDMGHSFLEHDKKHNGDTEIDRIDSDGDYAPLNCRWVTKLENLKNKKTSKCVVPVCKKLTTSKYLLCQNHYKSQWQKMKLGNIKHYHEKLWTLK
jgi:hypothetical protein